MVFPKIEAIFYGTVFLISSIACGIRVLRDNEYRDMVSLFGRVGSSGIFGFGIIAIYCGSSSPSSDNSGFPLLAVAAFIGFLDKELQGKLIMWFVDWLFSKLGGPKSERE